MKLYAGWRDQHGTPRITVNGKPLRHVAYHSEEMAWGYGGSGPADTALSIFANYFHETWVTGEYLHRLPLLQNAPKCWVYHQAFKWDVVAGWGEQWELTSDQISH